MTYPELQIQFDLNLDNRVGVLKNADSCRQIDIGYLFVDQEDGQCYLFNMNGNLDDISTVKWIEAGAFANRTLLTHIKIPNTVESIRECVFYNCEHLINIEIPNSVKTIGYSAFESCIYLKNIKIPDSIENIGRWAFYNCPSLKEVVFKDKTIDEVKAMYCYPWGIINESIFKL